MSQEGHKDHQGQQPPSHCLFTPLSSRRRGQYRCIKAETERLKNSFYLKAIRLLNTHTHTQSAHLHSSWERFCSYFSLTWDTPISGWSQWTWPDWEWLSRRLKHATHFTLWMSKIFWMIPCSGGTQES
ncbi:unnamed protein product [Oncorhynchus mykiss]|uniref:Uncharacterized protein n=1 Tax=Oncorhynchus mykiss TaxID=8022 RepID=A0A060YEG9_ONCMY|nr:unnamed protein product [Oncorhynchus mykiss]